MKRIILTLLIFFALCITAQADEQNSTVRVGLMYGSSAQSSVTVSGSGMQYGTVTGAFAPSGSFQSDSVTLTVADANTLTDGTNVFDVSSGTFALMPANGFFTLNGKQYRGCVLLKIQSDGNITVINCLTLDEYLYGVIGSEMPSAWNIEALKAQAVCARGFTLTNTNKHADYGFNVCATTNCQVYGGVAAETESTRRAVDETSGKALKYNGEYAQTVFFSCSGGHTADVRNVWGGDIPYLYGVDDPYESSEAPKHTWAATLTNEDIRSALAKVNVDVGEILSLDAQTDASEHVYRLTVKGTGGEYTFKNLDTCSVFASYGLLSNKYTVSPYGGTSAQIYALSSAGTSAFDAKYALSSNGTGTLGSGFSVLSSAGKTTVSPSAAKGYVFNGGGWGHGVGMSQYGAKGMADAGFTYDKILYHYYPGTNLE